MSTPKIMTNENWADNSPLHQQALKDGNDHYRLWQRNVIDEFKSLEEDQIKLKLKETAFPYAVLFENLINDFNISSSIRNANAFNAKEVFYMGIKKFDKRGMQGVHNYMDINFIDTVDQFIELKKRYKLVGFDNVPGSVPMSSYDWQPNTLICFGSEGVGLSPTMRSHCEDLVFIPQHGSVRSLNVATASGIAMYNIVQKFLKSASDV